MLLAVKTVKSDWCVSNWCCYVLSITTVTRPLSAGSMTSYYDYYGQDRLLRQNGLVNDKQTYEELKRDPTPALQRKLNSKLLDT